MHYQMSGRPRKTLAWHSLLEVYGQWLARLQVLPDAVHKLPVFHLDLRPPFVDIAQDAMDLIVIGGKS
jgi:hypothetical protein